MTSMDRRRPRTCDLCNDEEIDGLHLQSSNHAFNYMLKIYQDSKTSLRSNRHGIEVHIDIERKNGFEYKFDTKQLIKKGIYLLNMSPEEFTSHGCKVEFSCEIKNIRKNKNVAILYAGVLHPYGPFSMIDLNNNIEQNRFIQLRPGEKYYFKVVLTLAKSHVSNFSIPVFFDLQSFRTNDENNMTRFSIARTIMVSIKDENILEQDLWERSPFTHNPWQKVETHRHSTRYMTSEDFKIPSIYKRALALWCYGQKNNIEQEIWQQFQAMLHPGRVTADNYADFWKLLLWLEEMKTKIALQAYNMESVPIESIEHGLRLEVPGLGEKRPSVIKGDKIVIKVHGSTNKSYEGIIGNVGDRAVDIMYLDNEIIEIVSGQPDILIDVKFVLGRIHFNRMHHGVDQVVSNGFTRQLFPDERLLRRPYSQLITLSENDFRNKNIYRNTEQRTAVTKIVNMSSKGAAPYIVYGPPGTGKTVTIAESIYQLKCRTNVNILVCAPANAACHMLTDKLAEFCDTSELVRVMSETCDTSSIHDNIVKYCNVTRVKDIRTGLEKLQVIPFLKEDLQKYRIVVTTLVFAGKYSRIYHPDVVFLDEAAQASEPEACCALSLLMSEQFVVLAGDPKQLGPIFHNNVCKEYGFDVSLLERFTILPLYQKDLDGDNNFITMLKLNFRSHKEVLEIPNELFYDNRLKACSVTSNHDPLASILIHSIVMKSNSNRKGNAIEFCAVIAKEKRHGRSPSYFNPSEVNLVLKYVRALISQNVKPLEIGIVTPYIRQVYKIRQVLSPLYKDEIEVGTTEAFQGREKRVIIISTVRGQHDLLLEDSKYKIGFVKEPKRFNVAITRAKSKLIVIGNPLILSRDRHWKQLIEQTKLLGSHEGVPYNNRDEQEREEISRRFTKMTLTDSIVPATNGR